ncbi:MAG: hypothetical protein DMG30_17530 [Acidobacteria bacterium]|nr:MAG: hypothetical protein DMG30_17530 [Acidobacteriota bacterium]
MRDGISRLRWVRAATLMLLGLVAAWSWLFLVSKWGPAKRIDILTFKAGVTSRVMRTLLRFPESSIHEHDAAGMSAIYATPEYYAMTDFEDIHMGELPEAPPTAALRLDNGEQLTAVDTTVLRDSYHHRVSVIRFPNTNAQGNPLISEKRSYFELVAEEAQNQDGEAVRGASMMQMVPAMEMSGAQVMRWDLPLIYPKNAKGGDLSLSTLLALLAGLLAVLSPCLLQLTIYYTFALAGIGMQPTAAGIVEARSQVIRTALQFIAGFTIVFTATGSLAGLAGEKLHISGWMDNWNRPLGIASGLGMLIVGVWVGLNAGAPGLCRLPVPAVLRARRPWLDRLKVMFIGSAFAVGCSTCFGGALFISLMIYVGTVGSPFLGALALFLFSLGIAIPYLLAAIFLSRALPLLRSLHRARAAGVVGLVCSFVLVFFGVILITDNFHVPSNLLYRLYLGL